MTMPSFQFDIITISGKKYSGPVASLVVAGEKGSFGVLASHAPLISICIPGKLKISEPSGNIRFFLTKTGFFEVFKNRAILLTDSAVEETSPTIS